MALYLFETRIFLEKSTLEPHNAFPQQKVSSVLWELKFARAKVLQFQVLNVRSGMFQKLFEVRQWNRQPISNRIASLAFSVGSFTFPTRAGIIIRHFSYISKNLSVCASYHEIWLFNNFVLERHDSMFCWFLIFSIDRLTHLSANCPKFLQWKHFSGIPKCPSSSKISCILSVSLPFSSLRLLWNCLISSLMCCHA